MATVIKLLQHAHTHMIPVQRFCVMFYSQFSSVLIITDQKKFFKNCQIYVKNVQCPETNS